MAEIEAGSKTVRRKAWNFIMVHLKDSTIQRERNELHDRKLQNTYRQLLQQSSGLPPTNVVVRESSSTAFNQDHRIKAT